MVCLTAYTAPMAKILARHCDMLLVGDSVGNVLYGFDNTLSVDLETMIRHGAAVRRGAPNAFITVDMPYGSYEISPEQAHENARRVMAETKCDAVKIEGGASIAPSIEYLTARDIPVMAHIGLMPQSVLKTGGYKIRGKTPEDELQVIEDAMAIDRAGAFAVVIEGTIENVAAKITKAISIPTIGIGASVSCDGQILVTEDMMGMLEGKSPKFVKKYADIAGEIDRAVAAYATDVRARTFPDANYIYESKKKTCQKT